MLGDGAFFPLDLALRGASAVLLLLLAGLLARDHGRTWAGRLGALFALGAAAFAETSMVGFRADGSLWRSMLAALSAGNNVVFWLFARALFDDTSGRPRAWQLALWAVMVIATLICGLALRPAHSVWTAPIDAALTLAALTFAILAVAQTIASWPSDLIEGRRRLRVLVVGVSAAYIAMMALANLLGAREAAPGALSLACAIGLALITSGVSWRLLGVAGGDSLFLLRERGKPAAGQLDLTLADRQLLASIERSMNLDRVYRQDQLTIGRLAGMHGVPEHRLRRLINQGLGHRNFNSFLNGYRIADAQAGLADKSQAEVPILTIAFDAGFSSLGPFNRAFKQETGVTPSEFRKAALGRAEREPSIPFSAGRIPKSA